MMQVSRLNEIHEVPPPLPFICKSSSIFPHTVNVIVLVDLTRNCFNQFHISVYCAYLLLYYRLILWLEEVRTGCGLVTINETRIYQGL